MAFLQTFCEEQSEKRYISKIMVRYPRICKYFYRIIILMGVLNLALKNYPTMKWLIMNHESTSGHDAPISLLNTNNNVIWKETLKTQPRNLSLFEAKFKLITKLKSQISPPQLPWFMSGGTIQPTLRAMIPLYSGAQDKNLKIWPGDAPGDRIENQLMLILSPQTENVPAPLHLAQYYKRSSINIKTIFLKGINYWVDKPGQDTFLRLKCPVNTCSIITDELDERANNADAVLFSQEFEQLKFKKKDQIWIMFEVESPLHTHPFYQKDIFNWTTSYRPNSDITYVKKFIHYNPNVRQINNTVNYAENKTKLAAWFVSNCDIISNGRNDYVKELAKYIDVDIYGRCGSKSCPRSNKKKCFDILRRDYKFYLAFENSNCRSYITEKFFVNSLGNNVIPVVMGAHPNDYKRVGPEHSYIHVDDFDSPKQLAQYLHKLDKNDHLYNEYFRWKGTGEFLDNNLFMCRLCAMIHAPKRPKHYEDISKWWNPPGNCVSGKWSDLR